MFEYFEETDSTFKDILQVKSSFFAVVPSSVLLNHLSSRFDTLYSEFDKARGSCTQSLYKRCLELISQLDENLTFVQSELRSIAEPLYNKSSSPHNLMEKLKVIFMS